MVSRTRLIPLKLVALGLITIALLILMFVPHHFAHAQEGEDVLEIGSRNQVFIDGRFLHSAQNVRIVACAPRKTCEECLVSPSKEAGGPGAYATIVPTDGVWEHFRGFYALSKDGIHWRRVGSGDEPEPDDIVGLYNGARFPFFDPTAPAQERYKLFSGHDNTIRTSSDGVHWQLLHQGIFPEKAMGPWGMDSHNKCFYNTRLGKYVVYVRVNETHPAPERRQRHFAGISERFGQEGVYSMRAIGRSVTDDLSSFPMPEVVFAFDEQDPHFGGVAVLDFYTPEVVEYAHAQDAYYLFTSRYLHYKDWYLADDLSSYPWSTGPMDIGLAASRDGVHWHRYDREPWVPLGSEGAFDSKSILMYSGMFAHEDEIWMYYVGYPELHGRLNHATMSRVVLLKDRFTGIEAEYTGGSFTTPLLRFTGEALHLNVNTSAPGIIRVEIQGSDGHAIDGYTMDDCDRIHTANTVDHVVRWRGGNSDISALAGQPIRLRFELQYGAKLHAFRFGPAL